MTETFIVPFDIPDGIDYLSARSQTPVITSNLLVASETIKLRLLKEKGSYSEEDVYNLIFKNYSFWLEIISRSFEVKSAFDTE